MKFNKYTSWHKGRFQKFTSTTPSAEWVLFFSRVFQPWQMKQEDLWIIWSLLFSIHSEGKNVIFPKDLCCTWNPFNHYYVKNLIGETIRSRHEPFQLKIQLASIQLIWKLRALSEVAPTEINLAQPQSAEPDS